MIFDDKEFHGFSNETIVARFDLTLSVVMMSTFKKKTLVFLRIISFQLSVTVFSTTQGRWAGLGAVRCGRRQSKAWCKIVLQSSSLTALALLQCQPWPSRDHWSGWALPWRTSLGRRSQLSSGRSRQCCYLCSISGGCCVLPSFDLTMVRILGGSTRELRLWATFLRRSYACCW